MSATHDYVHGRVPEALACWGEQLAAGRSWDEVQDEIISCCQGRVDLLTALLIEAETLRERAARAPRRATSACTPFVGAVPHPRHSHGAGSDRVPATVRSTRRWY